MSKKGITMTSLVVYIILLATFTTIALTVSNNLSKNVFVDKGEAINLSNFDKVLYYLNKSAVESSVIDVTATSISFANGDEYTYNSSKTTIYYNGGILCTNVNKFIVDSSNKNLLNITIGFEKYAHNIERTISIYIGG